MKLIKQEQLIHLPHLEDLLFQYGNDGLIYINDLFDSLLKSKAIVKIKIDGSPSIIVGWRDHRFFVATKSLFNKKTPKINFTPDDIQKNHGDKKELAQKLNDALTYLKDCIPNNGVEYQGDFLFNSAPIEAEGYELIKPNIIAYGINPVRSDVVPLSKYKIGIVFHTSYVDGKVNYNPDLRFIKRSKDVFILDNDLHNYNLSQISRNIIKNTKTKWLEKNTTNFSPIIKHSESLCQFINKRIKEDKAMDDSLELAKDFLSVNSSFDESFLVKLFACYCKIAECKQHVINDLNKTDFVLDEFFYVDRKLTPTEPEGYVIVFDGVVKFVNRQEFSKENFNQKKDWET